MERSPGARRTPFTFSDSVHRQLTMYALAASAAGAGVFALSPPVQAKIVYTPANVGLRGYSLDLNHDGITDFTFRGSSTSWSSRFQSALGVSSPPHNAVMGKVGQPCSQELRSARNGASGNVG